MLVCPEGTLSPGQEGKVLSEEDWILVSSKSDAPSRRNRAFLPTLAEPFGSRSVIHESRVLVIEWITIFCMVFLNSLSHCLTTLYADKGIWGLKYNPDVTSVSPA